MRLLISWFAWCCFTFAVVNIVNQTYHYANNSPGFSGPSVVLRMLVIGLALTVWYRMK